MGVFYGKDNAVPASCRVADCDGLCAGGGNRPSERRRPRLFFQQEQPVPGAYTDVAGIYHKIGLNEKIVMGSHGSFLLANSTSPDPAVFLPRDMGDGSFTLENRRSEKRIAVAPEGAELSETVYDIRGKDGAYAGLNDNTSTGTGKPWTRRRTSTPLKSNANQSVYVAYQRMDI